VGAGPSLLAADPATHTIYVANGDNDNGPNAGGDTVSVIDSRQCNAQDVSRCAGPWPTITVGNGTASDLPSGIAVDQSTDTVYVTNVGADTVSVFNGAICNATDTSGCTQVPAEVPVGLEPIDLFADPVNHTVYVANFDNGSGASTTLSMINSATCTGTDLSACPTTQPPTVSVGAAPDAVSVDLATHTAYVTTIGALNGWSVFDTNTCDATNQSGCEAIGTLPGDPAGPNDGEVDPANDTLYTANYDNTISVFDLHDCWAGDLAGCATDMPGTVTFPYSGFDHALYVAVDASLDSVYVSMQNDAVLVIVDTRSCNGADLSGCAALSPPTIHTGAEPEGVVLDSQTQTLYTANEIDNDISVIAASQCNAEVTSGCRMPAPAVSVSGPGLPAVDQSVHTVYVPSGEQDLTMINTTACSAGNYQGCTTAPRQAAIGVYPQAAAVDIRTGTVYVANYGDGTAGSVSVVSAATCNATASAGCASAETLQLPVGNPDDIAIDAATNTIYVAAIATSGPNIIWVFNGATCDAEDTTGCNQTPSELQVADSGGGISNLFIAVSERTNTVYATNVVYTNQTGDTLYVIDGATCDAVTETGCNQTPATVTVGDDQRGLAVDPATDTIYVVNHAAGDYPGTLSVVNGATCNGMTHSGCSQAPATVAAGFGAWAVAVDPATDEVYVTNLQDTSVSVISGATCNGEVHVDCDQTPSFDAVGNYPIGIALDPGVGTAYVVNLDNTVSVIPLRDSVG
jgi:DNA-binding beta-propeller fold protein YncE